MLEPPAPEQGLPAGSWGAALELLHRFFFLGLEFVNDRQVVFYYQSGAVLYPNYLLRDPNSSLDSS